MPDNGDTGGPDVVVLRGGSHGISTTEYATALRERLPDLEVQRARTAHEEHELIANATVATGGDIDDELLAQASSLELFACTSAGVGKLPLETLAERGIAVTNAAGVHGPNIAEHVLGSIIMFARRFRQFWRQQERHEWRRGQASEVYGSTVTVVGLGALGAAVTDRLKPFGVETIGVRYTPEKGGPTDQVVGLDDEEGFQDALARTDYLVIASPLTERTRGLIGEAELETLEPNAVLINVARGPIVDTTALVDALQSNSIGGAALDVADPEPLPQDHELWNLDNVFLTPHASGHTPEYYQRCADILATNWDRLGSDSELQNRVA